MSPAPVAAGTIIALQLARSPRMISERLWRLVIASEVLYRSWLAVTPPRLVKLITSSQTAAAISQDGISKSEYRAEPRVNASSMFQIGFSLGTTLSEPPEYTRTAGA